MRVSGSESPIASTAAVLLGAILLAGWTSSVQADDWPMFRGNPSLTGISTNRLPNKLTKLWEFKTGGAVKSSPAIAQGKVYVGSLDQKVYALDLRTGAKAWEFKTEGGVESSPLVLEGRVYVGSEDTHLYALNAKTGALDWKFATGDKILGGPNWVASPKPGEKWILAGSYDFKLYCLEAATGKSNWVYESSNYINGTPAVSEGKTVFGGCDALIHVISLTNGSKIKEFEAGAYIAGSSALVGKYAYVGHYENEFLCFDLEKGTNIWSFKDRNFPYFSSPAVTADRVIFGGRDKRLHCLKRSDGTSVWTFATRGKVDSSPVVSHDKVVVGSDDGFLYLVSLADGKEIWSYEIGQAVGSSPAIAEGRIIVGSEDGRIYCFGTP
ncbi:MAG: PQQ-binding-like beta-propeller repeat protein [Verrucomicrobiales bacterium]|nr:PQQ-binding-like beta-propeller repeat protein [Verrucomicrobiales bacterium]